MVFIFSLVFHLNTCFSNFERLKKRTVQGDLKLDSCEQGIQREVNPRKKKQLVKPLRNLVVVRRSTVA